MSTYLVFAIGLSLLSAVAYALAAVTQERLAVESATTSEVTSLLGSARGWAAIFLNSGGALLHVAALAFGSLAVVQPLGALTLVVALPVGAAVARRRVRGREWWGAAATVAGLAGLLLAANTGAPSHALGDPQVLALLLVTATVIGVLARPRRSSRVAGVRLAVAGGVAFAVGSVLTQTVLLRLTGSGSTALLDPLLTVAIPAIGALSVGGLLLSQAAYKYGLGAQLATLTIVNPVVAAAIGLGLLGQGAGLSLPAIGVAGIAAVLAAVGVVELSTPEGSPVGERRHRLAPSQRPHHRSGSRRRHTAVRCSPAKATKPSVGASEPAYREATVGWSSVDAGRGSDHGVASAPAAGPRRAAAAPGKPAKAPSAGG